MPTLSPGRTMAAASSAVVSRVRRIEDSTRDMRRILASRQSGHRLFTRCIVAPVSASMVLLGLLERGPGHGYELKADHDEWFPSAKPLAFGQVYATLAR